MTRGAGGPHVRRQGRIRPTGPPNERVDRFIAAQTQRYKEEKAAEAALKRETEKLVSTAPIPTPTQTRQQERQPPQERESQGIEARISKAHAMANTAHNLAASVRSDFSKHMGSVEERFEAARQRVVELEREVATLRDAAKDAWFSTFWMYADVVQNVAILDSPPPKAKIMEIIEAPGTAILFGEMVQTKEGPAMQCRWVDPKVGQISAGWMLLRDNDGNEILTNFRLVY
jgi:cell division protein FtsB